MRKTSSSASVLDRLLIHFPGDRPEKIAWRAHLLEVCEGFIESGRAGTNFVQELSSGEVQKFWACLSEALIAKRLSGFEFGDRTVGVGPDFLVIDGNQKIWVEVICPEPINIPEDWLSSGPNGSSLPHREILLRWTSAIKAKAEALLGSADGVHKGYMESGIVSSSDAYVIAVNGCRFRSGVFPQLHGISQLPFAV